MSGTYVSADELRAISDLIGHLNGDSLPGLSLQGALWDANGEIVGYVRIGDSGEYAFHTEAEDE